MLVDRIGWFYSWWNGLEGGSNGIKLFALQGEFFGCELRVLVNYWLGGLVQEKALARCCLHWRYNLSLIGSSSLA